MLGATRRLSLQLKINAGQLACANGRPGGGRLGITVILSGTSVWRTQSRYTVSRIECRIKFPPQLRDTPPNQGVAPFSGRPPPPRRTFLSDSKQAGGRGAGGLCRGTWVPKTDRATGGCRSYSHTSRASLRN